MSNIIKSSRVVEEEKKDIDRPSLDKYEEELRYLIENTKKEAEEQYEKIVESARDKAEIIITEASKEKDSLIKSSYDKSKKVLEQAKKEGYNAGFSNGYQEGYEKGYEEGKLDSNVLIEEALEVKEEYYDMKNTLLSELEQELIELVIKIYEKLVNQKIEEDNDLIVSLVQNGINNLDITEKLTIISSKEDYDILEMSKNQILASASMITELKIKFDSSLKKGDCILETSKGNIDVSIKKQLDEVRELLTTILNNNIE